MPHWWHYLCTALYTAHKFQCVYVYLMKYYTRHFCMETNKPSTHAKSPRTRTEMMVIKTWCFLLMEGCVFQWWLHKYLSHFTGFYGVTLTLFYSGCSFIFPSLEHGWACDPVRLPQLNQKRRHSFCLQLSLGSARPWNLDTIPRGSQNFPMQSNHTERPMWRGSQTPSQKPASIGK